MSGFSPKQLRALRRRLERRHVQSRDVDGRTLNYVEGWFAIAEANAIFGFDGWDREMTHFERLYERSRNDRTNCGYLARIRIRVRAGENIVVREGTGWGNATASVPGEAHERALKSAETDATKRALATFGNRFGLGLYDKEQLGVTPRLANEPSTSLCLYQPEGGILAENVSPEAFCSGLRQLIENIQSIADVETLMAANKQSLGLLRKTAPNLKTSKGIHYADVLVRLADEHISGVASVTGSADQTASTFLGRQELPTVVLDSAPGGHDQLPSPASLLKPSKIANGERIDKSELTIGTERRFRDKTHLQFVGSQPCLICGRQPSHAHHLTFAQQRGLSIKVSDEFTVPRCAAHHDELHRSGSEQKWWTTRGTDPMPAAAALWAHSREQRLGSMAADVETPRNAISTTQDAISST